MFSLASVLRSAFIGASVAAVSWPSFPQTDIPAFDPSTTPDLGCTTEGFVWGAVGGLGLVTQRFGEYDSVFPKRFHTGVDIDNGSIGAQGPVIEAAAITRGRVVAVFDSEKYAISNGAIVPAASTRNQPNNNRFQRVVLLKHTPPSGSDPFWTMYGHLDNDSTDPTNAYTGVAVGQCLVAGTPLGRSIERQNHHIHIEFKSGPVEVNPNFVHSACAQNKCYGYSFQPPDPLGYSDPIGRIFGATPLPEGSFFDVTNPPQLCPLRAAPSRGPADKTCYGSIFIGDSYIALRRAPSPASNLCKSDWYEIARVAAPDCRQAGHCFGPTGDLALTMQVPQAWVCGDAGSLSGSGSANLFQDDFSGTSMDLTKWNLSNPGHFVLSGGIATFRAFGLADTQGKFEFQARKIVFEARMTGNLTRGQDTSIAIREVNGPAGLEVGDTNYRNWGFYAVGYGGLSVVSSPYLTPNGSGFVSAMGSSSREYLEYRFTLEGSTLKVERGPTLDNITQTTQIGLQSPIDGRTFYIYLRTGDNNYSPGAFDWVRVMVEQ